MSRTASITRRYSGRSFDVESHAWTDADGRAVEKDVVRHPGAVCVIALEGDGVVMIRNHRISVAADLWELPAGGLEPDEAPEDAAVRELHEETGRIADVVTPLGMALTSPGLSDERMFMFEACGLRTASPALQPGERIESHVLPVETIVDMIDRGEIIDAKTIVTVWRWLRDRERGGGGAS